MRRISAPKDGGYGGSGKVYPTFNDVSVAEREFGQYLSVLTQYVNGLQYIGGDGG
jgi:hypothetical protein